MSFMNVMSYFTRNWRAYGVGKMGLIGISFGLISLFWVVIKWYSKVEEVVQCTRL